MVESWKNYYKGLTWSELMEDVGFYMDFPRYRATERDKSKACFDEHSRRVKAGETPAGGRA